MQENTMLLQMEHITKRFTGSVALLDASIHVARGEVHALIGENGAGKSTLIKVLTGAYSCDEGSIFLMGASEPFNPPNKRRAKALAQSIKKLILSHFAV